MKQHNFIPLVTFRGWSKVEGEFVCGYYIYSESLNKHYIVQDACLSNQITGSVSFSHFFEVDKDSLGIYTGKDDKNGTPIFCGVAGAKYGSDLVKILHVNWFEDIGIEFYNQSFNVNELTACEVIGNQYEQHLAKLAML